MKRILRKWGFAYIILLGFFAFAQVVGAQDFPTKPITLVIGMGAGGSADLMARALASVAPNYLNQPMIVKIMTGGGGAIASDFVARSAPDGYTLLLGIPQSNTTIPAIEGRSKGPDDLAAVCRINYSPFVVGIRPDLPFKTFKQMLEWCKANPDKLIAGGAGLWSATDMFWKQLNRDMGIVVKSPPYDGGGPALLALLGGHNDTTVGFASVFLPYIKTGKMLAVAVLSDKRDPALPEVPTAKEEGIDAIYILWRSILAPKGTPQPIIAKLAEAFKKMGEDKSLVQMIKNMGDDIQYLGPNEFTKLWRAEYEAQKKIGELLKKK